MPAKIKQHIPGYVIYYTNESNKLLIMLKIALLGPHDNVLNYCTHA